MKSVPSEDSSSQADTDGKRISSSSVVEENRRHLGSTNVFHQPLQIPYNRRISRARLSGTAPSGRYICNATTPVITQHQLVRRSLSAQLITGDAAGRTPPRMSPLIMKKVDGHLILGGEVSKESSMSRRRLSPSPSGLASPKVNQDPAPVSPTASETLPSVAQQPVAHRCKFVKFRQILSYRRVNGESMPFVDRSAEPTRLVSSVMYLRGYTVGKSCAGTSFAHHAQHQTSLLLGAEAVVQRVGASPSSLLMDAYIPCEPPSENPTKAVRIRACTGHIRRAQAKVRPKESARLYRSPFLTENGAHVDGSRRSGQPKAEERCSQTGERARCAQPLEAPSHPSSARDFRLAETVSVSTPLSASVKARTSCEVTPASNSDGLLQATSPICGLQAKPGLFHTEHLGLYNTFHMSNAGRLTQIDESRLRALQVGGSRRMQGGENFRCPVARLWRCDSLEKPLCRKMFTSVAELAEAKAKTPTAKTTTSCPRSPSPPPIPSEAPRGSTDHRDASAISNIGPIQTQSTSLQQSPSGGAVDNSKEDLQGQSDQQQPCPPERPPSPPEVRPNEQLEREGDDEADKVQQQKQAMTPGSPQKPAHQPSSQKEQAQGAHQQQKQEPSAPHGQNGGGPEHEGMESSQEQQQQRSPQQSQQIEKSKQRNSCRQASDTPIQHQAKEQTAHQLQRVQRREPQMPPAQPTEEERLQRQLQEVLRLEYQQRQTIQRRAEQQHEALQQHPPRERPLVLRAQQQLEEQLRREHQHRLDELQKRAHNELLQRESKVQEQRQEPPKMPKRKLKLERSTPVQPPKTATPLALRSPSPSIQEQNEDQRRQSQQQQGKRSQNPVPEEASRQEDKQEQQERQGEQWQTHEAEKQQGSQPGQQQQPKTRDEEKRKQGWRHKGEPRGLQSQHQEGVPLTRLQQEQLQQEQQPDLKRRHSSEKPTPQQDVPRDKQRVQTPKSRAFEREEPVQLTERQPEKASSGRQQEQLRKQTQQLHKGGQGEPLQAPKTEDTPVQPQKQPADEQASHPSQPQPSQSQRWIQRSEGRKLQDLRDQEARGLKASVQTKQQQQKADDSQIQKPERAEQRMADLVQRDRELEKQPSRQPQRQKVDDLTSNQSRKDEKGQGSEEEQQKTESQRQKNDDYKHNQSQKRQGAEGEQIKCMEGLQKEQLPQLGRARRCSPLTHHNPRIYRQSEPLMQKGQQGREDQRHKQQDIHELQHGQEPTGSLGGHEAQQQKDQQPQKQIQESIERKLQTSQHLAENEAEESRGRASTLVPQLPAPSAQTQLPLQEGRFSENSVGPNVDHVTDEVVVVDLMRIQSSSALAPLQVPAAQSSSSSRQSKSGRVSRQQKSDRARHQPAQNYPVWRPEKEGSRHLDEQPLRGRPLVPPPPPFAVPSAQQRDQGIINTRSQQARSYRGRQRPMQQQQLRRQGQAEAPKELLLPRPACTLPDEQSQGQQTTQNVRNLPALTKEPVLSPQRVHFHQGQQEMQGKEHSEQKTTQEVAVGDRRGATAGDRVKSGLSLAGRKSPSQTRQGLPDTTEPTSASSLPAPRMPPRHEVLQGSADASNRGASPITAAGETCSAVEDTASVNTERPEPDKASAESRRDERLTQNHSWQLSSQQKSGNSREQQQQQPLCERRRPHPTLQLVQQQLEHARQELLGEQCHQHERSQEATVHQRPETHSQALKDPSEQQALEQEMLRQVLLQGQRYRAEQETQQREAPERQQSQAQMDQSQQPHHQQQQHLQHRQQDWRRQQVRQQQHLQHQHRGVHSEMQRQEEQRAILQHLQALHPQQHHLLQQPLMHQDFIQQQLLLHQGQQPLQLYNPLHGGLAGLHQTDPGLAFSCSSQQQQQPQQRQPMTQPCQQRQRQQQHEGGHRHGYLHDWPSHLQPCHVIASGQQLEQHPQQLITMRHLLQQPHVQYFPYHEQAAHYQGLHAAEFTQQQMGVHQQHIHQLQQQPLQQRQLHQTSLGGCPLLNLAFEPSVQNAIAITVEDRTALQQFVSRGVRLPPPWDEDLQGSRPETRRLGVCGCCMQYIDLSRIGTTPTAASSAASATAVAAAATAATLASAARSHQYVQAFAESTSLRGSTPPTESADAAGGPCAAAWPPKQTLTEEAPVSTPCSTYQHEQRPVEGNETHGNRVSSEGSNGHGVNIYTDSEGGTVYDSTPRSSSAGSWQPVGPREPAILHEALYGPGVASGAPVRVEVQRDASSEADQSIAEGANHPRTAEISVTTEGLSNESAYPQDPWTTMNQGRNFADPVSSAHEGEASGGAATKAAAGTNTTRRLGDRPATQPHGDGPEDFSRRATDNPSRCSSFNASAPVFVPALISCPNSPTLLVATAAAAAAAAAEDPCLANGINDVHSNQHQFNSRPSDTAAAFTSVHPLQHMRQPSHQRMQDEEQAPKDEHQMHQTQQFYPLPMQQYPQLQPHPNQQYQPQRQGYPEYQQQMHYWQYPYQPPLYHISEHRQLEPHLSLLQQPQCQLSQYGLLGHDAVIPYQNQQVLVPFSQPRNLLLTGVCLACCQFIVKPPAIMMIESLSNRPAGRMCGR